MSGGVDSSVAAYLLKKKGFQVIGLSFELWDRRGLADDNICCSTETIRLAKSVAHSLGIEHYTADVRDTFYRHVIEEFCESYIKGITPNPCILCNKFIKFDFLLKKADELGAEIIATGHYARTEKAEETGSLLLKKGIDPKKDQSYVLYVMSREELSRTLFPLGEMRKEETRSIAVELGLATALRAESQEICFVGDERYTDFIKEFSPESVLPGPVVNTAGKTVGQHRGIAFYTIGQRRGLGISSPLPQYVVNIDYRNNAVIVGSREDAMKMDFMVSELNWISIDSLEGPLSVRVKIRSTTREMPAIISPAGNGDVTVAFEQPQWAPAPGQSAVFYDGDTVIGGGVIQ